MKKILRGLIFLHLFFTSCTDIKHINGIYSKSGITGFGGTSIEFHENSNKFEYLYRGEWGPSEFSKGTWELKENKLYLFGFSNDNLKDLKIQNTIQQNTNDNKT